MDSPAQTTDYDFRSKYTETNPISRWLIQGFYNSAAGLIRQAAPHSLLEVGCGEGFSTEQLRAIVPGAKLEACDVEERLVEAARARNPEVPIVLDSIYSLQREPASFDMVVCMEVLEHLERPADALRELCRVSAKWLLLTVPREPLWRVLNMARLKYLGDLGNTPGHLQHWSSAGFLRFVRAAAVPVELRQPIPWTQVLAKIER